MRAPTKHAHQWCGGGSRRGTLGTASPTMVFMHKFHQTANTSAIRGVRWGGCVYRVAMLEPAPGKLCAMLGACLLALDESPLAHITQGTDLADFSGAYDLFVVCASEARTSPLPSDLSCRALLLPGDGQAVFAQIPSEWVTSFGLSCKDSITVSSLDLACTLLALRRELVTLDGVVIEQQEISLPIPHGLQTAELMALYGSLLLLGIPPERLCRGDFQLPAVTNSTAQS